MIDRIVDLAGLVAGCQVTEVGAGTGIATALLAARGLLVTAIEPDPAMARVLVERDLANVTPVVAGFEEWRPERTCQAIVSAQAWHWLDQAEAPKLAARALDRDSWLALMWNRPAQADPELDEVYARRAPSIASTTVVSNPVQRGAETRAAEGIEASGRYGPVVAEEVPWERDYTTEQWLDLISTHSDHRLLDPDARDGLFDDVRRVIDRRGGTHHVRYVTRLVAARLVVSEDTAGNDR